MAAERRAEKAAWASALIGGRVSERGSIKFLTATLEPAQVVRRPIPPLGSQLSYKAWQPCGIIFLPLV